MKKHIFLHIISFLMSVLFFAMCSKSSSSSTTPVASTFTITFNTNGGVPAIAPITVTENTTSVNIPANPTKAGYIFGGWFTDEALTTSVVQAASNVDFTNSPIKANITLYAKWLSNLSTWSQVAIKQAFPTRNSFASCVYDNKMWVIGGRSGSSNTGTPLNDIWYSTDGFTWTQVTPTGNIFSPRSVHTCFMYGNKMWVIGGTSSSGTSLNDIWYSTNGATWTQVAPIGNIFSERLGYQCFVYKGKMWVIGGYDGVDKNDVWCSTDGFTWTQVTPTGTVFSERYKHQCLVYDGKMWVIGGTSSGGTSFNDVWYSTDGATWTQVTPTGNIFSPRSVHTCFAYGNKMWVIGGYDDANNNDVWYSTDGATWTQQNTVNVFNKHNSSGICGLVYKNQVTLLFTGETSNVNEIWISP